MNGTQIGLLEPLPSAGQWNSDDYETPDWLAKAMAGLVLPSDEEILEPAAGSGQIAQYLPHNRNNRTQAIEISETRYLQGVKRTKCQWLNRDFLDTDKAIYSAFDLIITNPPFSSGLGMAFIERSLKLLNSFNPQSRLLFLLPGDYFQAQSRAEIFKSLDAHIHHKYLIPGRVAYLKNGVPIKGRQICDAVFDIRLGKTGAAVSYLEVA